MTTMPSDETLDRLSASAARLRSLHAGPGPLVLPNAWDAASAKRVEAAGFQAIATTSGGVAQALGFEDHEQAPMEEMAAQAARIARAVSIPLTVDFEAGYGLAPQEVAERVITIGASGLNYEDTNHRGTGVIDADLQAERIAQLRAAANSLGVPLVINARVDVFVQRLGTPEEQLAEGLRRARLYREAGADCVYPILLSDPAAIREMVAATDVVNINVRQGGPIDLDGARELGVRRVSYATSLFRDTMTWLESALTELRPNEA
jgi:2-methylisocitrate lyase-like PEP mutase family enzyme